jgi:hypothetical protein
MTPKTLYKSTSVPCVSGLVAERFSLSPLLEPSKQREIHRSAASHSSAVIALRRDLSGK